MTSTERILPTDADQALLVGRIYDPVVNGPRLVAVHGSELVDITEFGPTMSRLVDRPDVRQIVANAAAGSLRWPLEECVSDAPSTPDTLRLLSPIDLHVIKAAGVTFVESMLERVVEERAQGDRLAADRIRDGLTEIIGGAISSIRPGSPEAAEVKRMLIAESMWSPYLEVGIGPDPEVFTKAPVLSSVGCGEDVGIRSDSEWNNPEPEVVLIVRASGDVVGVTLGNDVNLRDIEGRSALLLGEAKDNNASCALGPFIRLLDDHFSMETVRNLDLTLEISGPEGYELQGFSSMRNLSRDPEALVSHVVGPKHQYPDGFALFTGTLFAPKQDRHSPGAGFTHELGDIVRISAPELGLLRNRVTHSESAPPWTYGIWSLFSNLSQRNLI